jgi:hypothetical protein
LSEPKNYIEINGRKYNPVTGEPLSIAHQPVLAPSHSIKAAETVQFDGSKPAHVPYQPLKHPKPENVSRSIKHAKAKSTQKSTTLMRPAVKKPEYKADMAKTQPTTPVIKHAPEGRLKRAGEVKQSPHIKRFNAISHRPAVVKKHAPVDVVEQKPAEEYGYANVIQESLHESVDHFEQVMHDATSHLETYVEEHTPKKFRKLAFATASLSVILLCGFVIYQAVPAVKVKIASTQAGFTADLPSYSPAGYGMESDIAASTGEVTLAYNSRTDNKGYKVHQQPSNWNSQSLVNNFLLAENKPYQTYENNGKTIYIYDKTNATWVDGGIWYKIEGDANLTSDQLLRIANGL